ncbi:unnamed protein product [Vitrella brassicaformis CCMP3155]|uniref:ODAD1 central coiled coil region domain-containing protein n=1 Tax=Vitrella brassicaformis (strain CCMP3155) TaxID=1169540 RepID=A0A0G4EKD5_VITBC|nr:unnamed protein product [Vitrella brassicaformis CCMP3155]|mmetsp:Transcript_39404/g.98619  ORF Transcript_39404/g.98619 Transcript_39404/m.98619 type:complete len:530 (-) Transcript_39404:2040-3629(-)|eukprot:CEL96993.1 unnamed protein product [Vitrella brassicaformis CCMP3155]
MATDEQQLEELQRRFHLMEGERKMTYEAAQQTLKQNKDTIKTLKEEAKTLRLAVTDLKKSTLPPENVQLTQKREELATSKTRLDLTRDENAKLHSELKILTDKLKELELNARRPTSDDSPHMKQIRIFENRLDKAMIKYNEAQSIRKTYEQIVKRLKDERVGFDHQLAAIEKSLKAKEHDYEELLLLSHDANHAKDMAQAELHRFEQSVIEERQQREKEVQEKKTLVQARVEMNQRLEQREREKKLQQEADRAGKEALQTTQAVSELAAGVSHAEAEDERQRMQDFEEAFRRIKEATGVSDVNEVIQKFLTQEETQNNLLNLTKENQARIDQLQEERARLRAKLEEMKFSSSGMEQRRQAVDDYEAQLNEANSRCERARVKYERVAKILVDATAGIDHLAEFLQPIKLDREAPETAAPGAARNVEDTLVTCDLKLTKLLALTNMEPQGPPPGLLETAKMESALSSMAQSIRVRLPEADADEDRDEDEYEDELDEEVWNRKHVKYNSQQLLEKQQKKLKKKIKGSKPRKE